MVLNVLPTAQGYPRKQRRRQAVRQKHGENDEGDRGGAVRDRIRFFKIETGKPQYRGRDKERESRGGGVWRPTKV